mmetsp:Transcript_3975/g.8964  ORF Transcript_3975/g.8964 Transcript_3975/m.8964 type:complete len:254 (-) Transcript_3975:632-1393(-)
MHSKCVLRWIKQNTHSMGHDTRFVERRLAIHQHHITIPQLPSNPNNTPHTTTPATITQQPCRNRIPSPFLHLTQIDTLSIRKLHPYRSGIFLHPSSHQRLHLANIQRSNRSGKRQHLGKRQRQSNLIRTNIRIGRDDRPTSEIDTLAHHVLTENTLLLLEQLTNTGRSLGGRIGIGIARRIHEAINGGLKVHPNTEGVCLRFFLLVADFLELPSRCGLGTAVGSVTEGILQFALLPIQFVNDAKGTPQLSIQL